MDSQKSPMTPMPLGWLQLETGSDALKEEPLIVKKNHEEEATVDRVAEPRTATRPR